MYTVHKNTINKVIPNTYKEFVYFKVIFFNDRINNYLPGLEKLKYHNNKMCSLLIGQNGSTIS